jgi:hypothetical protein
MQQLVRYVPAALTASMRNKRSKQRQCEDKVHLGCSPSGALRDMPRGLKLDCDSNRSKAMPAGMTVTGCSAAAALCASFMVC